MQYTSQNSESVLLAEAGMHWQGQRLLQNKGSTAPSVQITPCTQYIFSFPKDGVSIVVSFLPAFGKLHLYMHLF